MSSALQAESLPTELSGKPLTAVVWVQFLIGELGSLQARRPKKKKKKIVQPRGRALVSPQGIHRTMSLSFSADTETPTRWEKLTERCPQARVDPRLVGKQKVDDADSHLPHQQPIRRVSMS